MNYRRLGRTDLRVSEVGFGAWGIGKGFWVGAEDDQSLRALHRAIDRGVNFIDTALMYGEGHSEKLVGEAIRQHREDVYVATKVPVLKGVPPAPPGVPCEAVFPADHIVRSAETSLRNLNAETIDVLQFHAWQDDWTTHGDWIEAIQTLKQAGKIRFFGISVNDHEPANGIRAVEAGIVDTVQVIYNLFDQSPEDALFPACSSHDVGVIARVPFDEGGLTGKLRPDSSFDPTDFRARYFAGDRARDVYQRARAIIEDLDITEEQLPETALRFVLSETVVSTVIPGMRSLRNVDRNTATADGRPLTDEQRQLIKRHRWVRNFYN